MLYKKRNTEYEEARRLRTQGLTLKSISETVGVPIKTVHNWTRDVTTKEIVSANKVRHVGPNLSARKPLAEVLVEDGTFHRSWLRERLIDEGIFERCCDLCGLETWMGQPAPLELDHQNGVNNDNRLGNLRLLCPNCHAQTPTYSGRNIKKN